MEQYEIMEQVGRGAFGSAILVNHKLENKKYVLKKIRLARQTDRCRRSAHQEMSLVSKVQHPYIVEYKESWVEKGCYVCIVTGYCEGGDMAEIIKKAHGQYFCEERLLKWFAQLLLAVDYLHSNHVLHRDLKCSNIFLTKDHDIRLGDFGLAKILNKDDLASSVVGTPNYMCPELLADIPYGFKSDIWSLGCCMYEMTAHRPAFKAFDMQGLISKINRSTIGPLPSNYSSPFKSIIRSMLRKNPEYRPTAAELIRHPHMQPYVIKCQLQAAFHCRPPELPVRMSCTPPKTMMPSNVETSTDTESYTVSAKSTQDATSEWQRDRLPPALSKAQVSSEEEAVTKGQRAPASPAVLSTPRRSSLPLPPRATARRTSPPLASTRASTATPSTRILTPPAAIGTPPQSSSRQTSGLETCATKLKKAALQYNSSLSPRLESKDSPLASSNRSSPSESGNIMQELGLSDHSPNVSVNAPRLDLIPEFKLTSDPEPHPSQISCQDVKMQIERPKLPTAVIPTSVQSQISVAARRASFPDTPRQTMEASASPVSSMSQAGLFQGRGLDVKSFRQRAEALEGLLELSAQLLSQHRLEELSIVLKPFGRGKVSPRETAIWLTKSLKGMLGDEPQTH
ncbi:unnamed protein product, partial [Sphagnum balticum]